MKTTNVENFQDLIQSKVVIQFSASWCGPCKVLTRTIDENASALNIDFYKVDLDENRELSKQYKVIAVPTLILFDEGKEVKRMSGNKSLSQLKDFVE